MTVTDANGNTLTFTDAGIASSAGPQVTFDRDPQGRIVAATDPAGKTVQLPVRRQRRPRRRDRPRRAT